MSVEQERAYPVNPVNVVRFAGEVEATDVADWAATFRQDARMWTRAAKAIADPVVAALVGEVRQAGSKRLGNWPPTSATGASDAGRWPRPWRQTNPPRTRTNGDFPGNPRKRPAGLQKGLQIRLQKITTGREKIFPAEKKFRRKENRRPEITRAEK